MYKTEEPNLFVDIISPTQEDINGYYKDNGEIRSSSAASSSKPREFKRAIIKSTFDEERYPVGTEWIMGESPGITANFFGEKVIIIKTKDLYARIEK